VDVCWRPGSATLAEKFWHGYLSSRTVPTKPCPPSNQVPERSHGAIWEPVYTGVQRERSHGGASRARVCASGMQGGLIKHVHSNTSTLSYWRWPVGELQTCDSSPPVYRLMQPISDLQVNFFSGLRCELADCSKIASNSAWQALTCSPSFL